MNICIRQEREEEYRQVEELTRRAFWDVYCPGCVEHLLVNRLRKTSDFVKELDLVAAIEEKIVGHIIYSHGKLDGENPNQVKYINFGPISVEPDYQGQGIGSQLIQTSAEIAWKLGYDIILITGSPSYYSRFGFVPARQFGIELRGHEKDETTDFFMVKERNKGVLRDVKGIFTFDPCYDLKPEDVKEFDMDFQ